MNLAVSLIRMKRHLPFNGDWLSPTATPGPPNLEHAEDLASTYSNPDAFAEDLKKLTVEQLDFLDTEAEGLRQRVEARADHVRDKAKVLLGTNSFVGSVALGVVSLLAGQASSTGAWLQSVVIGGVILMLLQFGAALIRAMSAITREEVVDISTRDILAASTSKASLVGAKLVAANAYQIQITARVNKLILAQTGFQWGLAYACVVVVCLVIAVVGAQQTRRRGDAEGRAESMSRLEQRIEATSAGLQREIRELKALYALEHQLLKQNIEALRQRLENPPDGSRVPRGRQTPSSVSR